MTFPGGGESVGDAYIRLHVDGSTLGEGIREEFGKHDRDFDEVGREHNKAYNKGWDEEGKKRPQWAKSIKQMRESKGRYGRVGTELGGALGQNLRDEIIKEAGSKEIGDRIFKNLNDASKRQGSFRPFTQGMKNFSQEMTRAVEQIAADERRLGRLQDQARAEDHRRTVQRLREIDKVVAGLKGLGREQKEVLSQFGGAGHRFTDKFNSDIDRLTTKARQGDREALARLREMHDRTEETIHDGERGFLRLDGRSRASIRSMTDFERSIQRVHNKVGKLDLGRMFGKGSRNDFINILGSVVGKLGELAVKMALLPIERTARLFGDLKKAEGPLAKLDVIVGRLAGGLLGGIKAAGAFGAAIGAIQLIVGPIAAAVSMLAGVIVALASSISFALIGAVAALLPIMGALVAGVALAATAFIHLTDAQKAAVKADFKPTMDALHEVQDAVRKPIFANLGEQAKRGGAIIRRELLPVAGKVGSAISKIGSRFESVMEGRGFKQFMADFRQFLPGALTSIGRIGANVFRQITGLMHAALPVARQMLDALEKGSRRTAIWINSLDGQRTLTDWFERGWTSARKLWRLLKDVVKVFGDIINQGKDTGDTLIDSLSKQLERFDTFLNSPRGRKAFAQWMSDVEKFWGFLGKALGGLGKLFGALDNPDSRQALNTILKVIGDIGGLVADVLPDVAKLEHQFFTIIGRVADAAILAIKPLVPVFREIVSDLGGAVIAGLKILADTILIPLLHALGSISKFVAAHPHIFKPLIVSVLLLWGAFKGFTILGSVFKALALLPTRIGLMAIGMQAKLAQAAAFARTGAGRISSALAGIGLVLSAKSLGKAAGGGVGGGIVDALSNIGGGALIGGSIGGAPGAIIGGLIGGFKTIVDLTGDAQTSWDRYIADMKKSIAEIADTMKSTLVSDENKFGSTTKQAVADAITKGGEKSLATKADKLGIDPARLSQAFLGNQRAINSILNQLAPEAAGANQKISGDASDIIDALSKQAAGLRKGAIAADQYLRATEGAAAANKELASRTVTQQLQRLGHTLDGLNPSLKQFTDEGENNRRFITAHVNALKAQASAFVKSGGSADEAAAKFGHQTAALRNQLVEAGFSKAAVDKLIGSLDALPDDVITHLKASDAASPTIAAILEKLKHVPPEKRTRVIAEARAAIQDLQRIRDLIGDINNTSVQVGGHGGSKLSSAGAHGMVIHGAKRLLAGEAGPEALVPLRRPLSQVDPSVKALSAFAQGIPFQGNTPAMASGGIVGGGKTVNVESGAITVVDKSGNSRATAVQVLNEFLARTGN